jgi:hypothetical protein
VEGTIPEALMSEEMREGAGLALGWQEKAWVLGCFKRFVRLCPCALGTMAGRSLSLLGFPGGLSVLSLLYGRATLWVMFLVQLRERGFLGKGVSRTGEAWACHPGARGHLGTFLLDQTPG